MVHVGRSLVYLPLRTGVKGVPGRCLQALGLAAKRAAQNRISRFQKGNGTSHQDIMML